MSGARWSPNASADDLVERREPVAEAAPTKVFRALLVFGKLAGGAASLFQVGEVGMRNISGNSKR